MVNISEEKLLMLNQMGLIPAPNEDRKSFIERANYSLNLKSLLYSQHSHLQGATSHPEVAVNIPEELVVNLSSGSIPETQSIHEAAENLKKIYDCSPTWTPLFFSNYKLPFWHGGCAWIFQMTETSPTSALIQLRSIFNRSNQYLKIYHKQEILTHELSHVGRLMFQEPKFEELLAYRTAKSSFRRWVGPFIQSSIESALFLLVLFVLIVFDVFLLALGRPDVYYIALWLKVIPAFIGIMGVIRLYYRQRTYASCIDQLKKCVGSSKAEAVAYRLKDDEVILFSKLSIEKIREYAGMQMNKELRWHVIFNAYFS